MSYAVEYLTGLLDRCSAKLRRDFIRDLQHFGVISDSPPAEEITTEDLQKLFMPILASGISGSFLIAGLIKCFHERTMVPIGEDPSSECLKKMEKKLEGMYELRQTLDPSRRAGIDGRIRFYENSVLPSLRDAVEITSERRTEWEAVASEIPTHSLFSIMREINLKDPDHNEDDMDEVDD